MTRVIAVANHKGGVAKTTTAFQLAGAYALEHKARVLLIDLDPNTTLTTALHFKPENIRASVTDLLLERNTNPDDLIHATTVPGLFLIPATEELTAAEKGLATVEGGEATLARLLQPIAARFDVVVIDCPPALDLLNTNGIRAAQSLLIPVESSKLAAATLPRFINTLTEVSQDPAAPLEYWLIAITKHEKRTRHAQAVREALEARYPGRVFRFPIPHSVRAKDSLAAGLPVFSYAPTSAIAEAYRSLAQEVITHHG